MQKAACHLARWYFSSALGKPEHKFVRKIQVCWLSGQQRKEVSPGAGGGSQQWRGEVSLVEKGCLAKPTRMGILHEWQSREKPQFPRASYSASPQRAFQTREGFLGVTALGIPLAGMGPLHGPPLHTTLLCQAELSSPQACGVQQSKLYCPHTGAALQ